MLPIKQSHENCLQACIASIFNLDILLVPPMIDDDTWQTELDEFLNQYGLYHMICGYKAIDNEQPVVTKGYSILVGMTNRSDEHTHAVVCYDGQIVHDPHPSDDMLKTKEHIIVFVSTLEEYSW